MKLTSEFIKKMMKECDAAREKGREEFWRQTGAMNMCEWILKNVEFENAGGEKAAEQ